jgi:Sulfotransferase family
MNGSENSKTSLEVTFAPLKIFRWTGGNLRPDIISEPLVFHHIPKTAGTSLTLGLQAMLRSQLWNAQSEKVVRAKISEINRFRMISGHFSSEFLFEKFPVGSILTVLRDPVERAVSQFNDWHNNNKIQYNDPAWSFEPEILAALELAQHMSPMEFFRSENEIIAKTSRNVFVRLLSREAIADPFVNSRRLVDEAFESLRSMFWFGLQSEMDRGLSMLLFQLGLPTHGELRGRMHNQTERKIGISTVEAEEVRQINSLDAELFRLAEREFADRVRQFHEICVNNAIAQRFKEAIRFRESVLRFEADFVGYGGGWSYLEIANDHELFRWTEGDGPSQIFVPWQADPARQLVKVRVQVLSGAEALECDLQGMRALGKSLRRVDQRLEIEFAFDGEADMGSLLTLSFSIRGNLVINEIGESRKIGAAIGAVEVLGYSRIH